MRLQILDRQLEREFLEQIQSAQGRGSYSDGKRNSPGASHFLCLLILSI